MIKPAGRASRARRGISRPFSLSHMMFPAWMQGVIRGKPVRTAISDKAAPCPPDHVNRQSKAPRPNALRISGFTCVATSSGFAYVACTIDAWPMRTGPPQGAAMRPATRSRRHRPLRGVRPGPAKGGIESNSIRPLARGGHQPSGRGGRTHPKGAPPLDMQRRSGKTDVDPSRLGGGSATGFEPSPTCGPGERRSRRCGPDLHMLG